MNQTVGASTEPRAVHLAAAAIVVVPATLAHATLPQATLSCNQVTIPVALGPGQAVDQSIVGWLCARGSAENRTLQILVHGASYDHNYWDFPLQPDTYSYVQALTADGYATLNLDRVGSGLSSHPPDPTALTLHVGAYTLHEVVQAVRKGLLVPRVGLYQASRIMLVGHSFGSFIATIEASTYQDVDGVILSGYAHSLGPGVATIESSTYPAQLDPKFAAANLPAGYLTSRPGTRGQDFYYAPGADPAVIALDEQLKQTFTDGEVADIGPSESASSGILVPTQVVVGAFDSLYCAQTPCSTSGSLAGEASNYSPSACVEIDVVPDAGHSLNLHLAAPQWFRVAQEWSDRRVGANPMTPSPGCQTSTQ